METSYSSIQGTQQPFSLGDHLFNELAIRANSRCISHDFLDLVAEIALLE